MTVETRRRAALALPPEATSPSRARRFVLETLDAWGLAGGDDLVLVVSELVTNGLLHARTPMTVTLAADGPDGVLLSVSDGSAQQPQERHFSLESGTGRGLRLLAAIAREWGVDRRSSGKTVWARIALGEREYAEFDVDAVDAL